MSLEHDLLKEATRVPKPPLLTKNERVIEREWNRAQSEFLHAKERYVDFEGAVRAGKTTPAVWKLINYAIEYPGIWMLMTRWTQDSLDAVNKPVFYLECPPEILGRHAKSTPRTQDTGWNNEEEYQDFRNGSRLYIRALKTSDNKAPYAKFAGLTLGVIFIDQAEEVPDHYFYALKARLSQKGFPQQLFITPNPPSPDHWIAKKEFPTDNVLYNHKYIVTSVYDNRKNLGDDYITELEHDYPHGHVLRRRFIEGKRGLSIVGEPIYKHVFSRTLHVGDVDYLPDYPLIEAWDFGQRHPAVSWHQFLPSGWWNVLGYWQGSSQFIDDTVPEVAALRNQLYPDVKILRVCCDPAGADTQGHGIRTTAVDILNQHLRLVYGPTAGAKFLPGSNRPEKREWCIQQISGYMSRLIQGRAAFMIHPRCDVLIDGFEAGYVYDDRQYNTAKYPNIRRAKKDGYYDHGQNTVEYAVINYGQRNFTYEPQEQPAYDIDWMDEAPRRVRKSRAGY